MLYSLVARNVKRGIGRIHVEECIHEELDDH
jgi:hypothetical protein